MMIGLDRFRDFFKDYTDAYIAIGGAACDDIIEDLGLAPRATKDIDIILVVEAIDKRFTNRFWEFIEVGGYEVSERSEKREYFRFHKPKEKDYPKMIELLSRVPDLISTPDDARFTPIPADEEYTSLSAILMDEVYYHFAIEHSVESNGFRRANELALICLKAKAFLNLSESKANGDKVQSDDIKKHRNDVFRLAATLPRDKKLELPASIKEDVSKFIDTMEADPPETAQFLKDMGITPIDTNDLLAQLRTTFNLN